MGSHLGYRSSMQKILHFLPAGHAACLESRVQLAASWLPCDIITRRKIKSLKDSRASTIRKDLLYAHPSHRLRLRRTFPKP